jgi:hypothetical protein
MFTLARDASSNHVRLLHPESDWLWLLDEMGWLGPVFAFGMAALLLVRTFPLERKTSPGLRSAAAIAGMLFLLHGFFDVSGHRLGSAFPALLLFGLASRLPWTVAPSTAQTWIARVVAVALIVAGAGWTAATAGSYALPGSLAAATLNQRASAANDAENFAEGLNSADRAISIAPLDWRNHYLRGVAHMFMEKPAEAALDLRRARRLEPSVASVPYEEGRLWMYFDPPRTKDAWAEALRREPDRNVEYFRRMLADAGNRSSFRQTLRELAGERTDLLLEWLATASPAEFHAELEKLLADGSLQRWSPAQLDRLFASWLRTGDRAGLIEALKTNVQWETIGWKHLAAAYAASRDFKQACATVRQFQASPQLPEVSTRDRVEAELQFARNPKDIITGLQAYRAEAQDRDWDAALFTLDRLGSLPDAPAYLLWLRADILEKQERWSEAWNALAKFIR